MKDFYQYGNRQDDQWEVLPWIPDPRPPFKIWVKPEQIAPFFLIPHYPYAISLLLKISDGFRTEEFRRLGLSGSDMSSYLLFPEEGIVMVDGMPCYCINAYGREDHQILDTYLVSEDGSGLYRLDRGEDAVSALT